MFKRAKKTEKFVFWFFALLLVLGIVPSYAATQDSEEIKAQADMIVIPSSGKTPLDVELTLTSNSELTCTSFYVDWGDGSTPIYYQPSSFTENCTGGKFQRTFSHTYKTSSTTIYQVKSKAGAYPLDKLQEMQIDVVVYGKNWKPTDPDPRDTPQAESCFLNVNSGFVPLSVQTVIPLGAGVCSENVPMKYWIDWGDGNKTQEFLCNTSPVHYHTLKHVYQKGGIYTATLNKQYSQNNTKQETCTVRAFENPQMQFLQPQKETNFISIGYPFDIQIGIKKIPPPINDIYPSIILGFTNTQTQETGFIGEIGSPTKPILSPDNLDSASSTDKVKAYSFTWKPSDKPCNVDNSNPEEGNAIMPTQEPENNQSSSSSDTQDCTPLATPITPGIYTLDAHLVYRACQDLENCKQEEIGEVASVRSHPIRFSFEKSIFNVVADRIFAIPQSTPAPAFIYFTTVLNADASCQGGTYTVDFGDGQSVTVAYPKNQCKSFAKSFGHVYTKPGGYYVTLIKNGIPVTGVHIGVTKPARTLQSLYGASVYKAVQNKVLSIFGKIKTWLGI